MNWIEKVVVGLPSSNIIRQPSTSYFDPNIGSLGINLPAEHLELLTWSNGGQIKFSDILFSFWSYSDISIENESYQIQKYLGENLIGIGSDGGPICFLLDYRESEVPKFSSVNFGDLDVAEIKVIAQSLSQALTLMKDGVLASVTL